MRPSYKELQDLWIYTYSRASLSEAEQWLDAMNQTDARSPQFRALMCAAVIAYARPFTISQITPKERVVPLRGVLPPPHLSDAHEIVLKLRDKVMGHKDATPAKGDSTTPNIMLIRRDVTGFNLHTIIIQGMTPDTRNKLKALCSHFVAHCESKVYPITELYGPEIMQYPEGEYELLISESPNDWIRKRE